MKKLLVILAVLAGLITGGCIGEDDMVIHITTLDQLQAMKDDLAADYILDNDIDASTTSGWNGGAGFEPIGTSVNRFIGSFNGGNHVISGLHINRPDTDYIGLFGRIDDESEIENEIKNIGLENVDITGKNRVGSLAGRVWPVTAGSITLSNCYATGNILAGSPTGTRYVGGLVGDVSGESVISNCHASVDITTESGTGDTEYIGGLVGENSAPISNCYATGNIITGNSYDYECIGGLVGSNFSSAPISNCYATGNIIIGNADDDVEDIGGLVGENYNNVPITNCYATGNITVGDAIDDILRIGGLVGKNSNSPVTNCYSVGHLTIGAAGGDISYVGGFCGRNGDIISNCFWDTETSGQDTSDGGTGKTTKQMQTKSTFTDTGWDFATPIWDICELPTYIASYPWLQWENIDCEVAAVDKEAPWKEDITEPTGGAKVEIPRRSGNWVTLEDIMRIHTSNNKNPLDAMEIGQAEVIVSNISRNFNSFEEASAWYKNLEGYALQIETGY